jgi:small acid-soluble spore protein F (minor alpha/beta-type SASP)
MVVAAHRSLLSAEAKAVIARELGVADLVQKAGWGAVPSRECGRIVRVAIEHAERLLAAQGGRSAPGARRLP